MKKIFLSFLLLVSFAITTSASVYEYLLCTPENELGDKEDVLP